MKRKKIWLGLLILVVTACGPLEGAGSASSRYASNGERIYFTGASANGRISYSGGDFGGGMMGGRGMMGGGQRACADCHGADGRGGRHVMRMTVMDAPDIHWSTLAEIERDDADHHGAENDMDHPPYDEEAFKRAVTQGLGPGGNPLGPVMPRWRMPEQDLDDLIAYLKTLD